MAEQRIELLMAQRIDGEHKATVARVDTIQASLHNLEREVSEINGKLKPPAETPWWIRSIAAPLCVAAVVGIVGALTTLLIKVNRIETFIQDNGGVIAGLSLEKISPSDPQKISKVQTLLKQAKSAKVRIPVDSIKSAGDQFIGASSSVPQAWDVVLELAQYRTQLNADALPHFWNVRAPDNQTGDWWIGILPPGSEGRSSPLNGAPANVWLVGNAPADIAAKIEPLDHPSPNSIDAQFMILDWVRPEVLLRLDGMRMKNIIIKNAPIRYLGGPIDLQNVYFVNCTFQQTQATPSLQSFARAILDAPSVNFRNEASGVASAWTPPLGRSSRLDLLPQAIL